MPDRPRSRNALPTWLPLAAGGAALALLLALIGGYFLYQDQQDRAARAAYSEYETVAAEAVNARVLQGEALSKKPLSSDTQFPQWKQGYDKLSAAAESLHVECLSLEERWQGHWRRLGLRSPLPIRQRGNVDRQ